MALSRFPAYLTLLRGACDSPRPAATGQQPLVLHEVLRRSERDALTGVAMRHSLLDRLETVGALAPGAPLSFVVVKVEGLARMNQELGPANGDDVLRAVARLIGTYTRATDTVGRLTGGSFGVVLQGTGATGAGAVAARLGHYLGQLYVNGRAVDARVTVATGRGINAEVLPAAAFDSLDDCG